MQEERGTHSGWVRGERGGGDTKVREALQAATKLKYLSKQVQIRFQAV